ncbi:MAG: efflux RND transporter periplasmic adaptor subunit [Bacteroidia bacterium]|jgi:multidrug efflux pump subunit AcrA (membrane-fusion protein)
MKRHYTLLFLLVVLLSCGEQSETISPQLKDITEAVYASGNLYPKNEYKVSANADGFLAKRMIDPGDSISIGDELFQIENELQSNRLETMGKIYSKAGENAGESSPALLEARKALKSAYDKMKFDSTNYARYKTLWDAGSIAKAQYDNVSLAYQLSKNEYEIRQESYRRLKNQLFIEWQNATNNYQAARKDEANTRVISNIDGKVYDVLREQGEAVRRGEILAMVGDASVFYLKLMVDELDIEKVRLGQEVVVKLDINPGKIYKARVSKIYPRLNREEQAFRVDAEFDGEKPESFYGVTVEANIIIQVKPKALTIPKAIVGAGDTVWVEKNGKAQKVHFKKGVESFDDVEVLEGIKADDVLIIQ